MPNINLDFEANRFWVDEKEVILTGTQYRLLKLFYYNKDRILTADTIIDHMWVNLGLQSDIHTLHNVLSQLRKKFGRYLITNHRGIGWGMLDYP